MIELTTTNSTGWCEWGKQDKKQNIWSGGGASYCSYAENSAYLCMYLGKQSNEYLEPDTFFDLGFRL